MMAQAGSSDDPAAATGNAARTSGPVGELCRPHQGARQAEHRPDRDDRRQSGGDGRGPGRARRHDRRRKLVTSSGATAWDETVLRAIDKTEVLPKDIDGRVPPTIIITFARTTDARRAGAAFDGQGSSEMPLT
jgi:colicin import membrane protein